VLDAFEASGWPATIKKPVADSHLSSGDAQRLHETIKSLNNGLKFMRFHADGTGERVVWKKVGTP
jgi:hypothetical protein